jgi:hypothetical protein
MPIVDKNSALLQITKISILKNTILPIFDDNPLLTSKSLDYDCFKKAILIKTNEDKTELSEQQKNDILNLKKEMNSLRNKEEINNKLMNNIQINSNWLLGFIEGEGTFGYKNLKPYFQYAQLKNNINTLEAIKKYLTKLAAEKDVKINITSQINKNTDVLSYLVSDTDGLYYFFLPYFENSSFQSRKYIDFKLWSIALQLIKKGYHLNIEGKRLLLKITKNSNKARYSTNSTTTIDYSSILEEALEILKTPTNFNSSLPYEHQARNFYLTNKKLGKLNIVYVYHNDEFVGKYLSYSSAQKAIGLKESSRMIYRYIDTNKKNKLGYSFYSQEKE